MRLPVCPVGAAPQLLRSAAGGGCMRFSCADGHPDIPAAGGKFTEAERAKVSLSNLVVYVNVSTAARVTPLDGSPKFGVPADWTREHKYSVMAADGTKKIWTVKVTLNK